MSLLTTPFWQNLNGDPLMGVSPPSLLVLSGRLTPWRHGEIRRIYMHFSMAKLTAVGDYFVFNRVLSDGTRVRIESMQGRDRVLVWAVDAKPEDLWDMGWSFIPANDNSLNGFLRRPGATPDSLSAAAFLPLGNFVSPAGKAVHTFVDAKTGKQRLCTKREGGTRMWRGGKKMPVLSYDRDAVWVDGVKSALNPDVPGHPPIMGAAIAERDGEKWLVFVHGATWYSGRPRLRAVRLGDLKEQTDNYIDCGLITDASYANNVQSYWEFSPDGMRAIALGDPIGYDGEMSDAPDRLRAIYRLTLTPESGAVPFKPEVSEQLHGEVIRKRVINTFHFNQAKRNFTFHGWSNFSIEADSTYYGAIHFDIESGWGPIFSKQNPVPPLINPQSRAEEHYRFVGAYFDPRMSCRMLDDSVFEFHTDPTNFTAGNVEVRIPHSDILFDDGYGPEEIIFTRSFHKRPDHIPPPSPGGWHISTGFYFPHLDGWLNESHKTRTIFHRFENTKWDPYGPGPNTPETPDMQWYTKFRERMAVGLVEQKMRFGSPPFPSLDDLSSFCDARWGAAFHGMGHVKMSTLLNNYYGALVSKDNYSSYLDFYEYLASHPGNLTDRAIKSSFVSRSRVVDLRGGSTTIHGEDFQIPSVYTDEGEVIYETFTTVADDGTVIEHKELVERTGVKTSAFRRINTFRLEGAVQATPDYTHNWTTDWVLDSQVFLTGKAYIAAGYDAEGRERFLYMEGDASKRLRYESSAKADNEPIVQLAWSFSGAMGYRLMLDEEVIDSCTYAVADSETEPDKMYQDGESAVGPDPTIHAGNITVYDFDMALGHVLYRKSEEVFTVVDGKSENRRTVLRLSYHDFLKTPKDKHQLGEERVFTSAQREVDFGIAWSSATKSLFYETAPCFPDTPDIIEINGVRINRYGDGFASLVPQAQRNKVGEWSKKVEARWSLNWVTRMMLYFPGIDNRPCNIPERVPSWNQADSNETEKTGRFDKPPQTNMVLRAYSDDCWLVCYQNERHIQNTDTDNTTARYFLKLAEDKPVGEFDAATYFPYLGASKKLLVPKFHIRKRT